ncbi:MAG: ABC transporter substrate-binding protein, partial [Deltaproteobacteria bacterium]|nr:ABC transporter substrate-binding protein [Deltaproteobacteria bacterium]
MAASPAEAQSLSAQSVPAQNGLDQSGQAQSSSAQSGLAQGGQAQSEALSGQASPASPKSGPWRVIYVEAGPYRDYVMNLAGLAKGLAELGLIENGAVPEPEGQEAWPTWLWLSENAGGDSLVFEKEGFYSADWDEARYPDLKREILERLKSREADLVLAFGTAAGLMTATSEHDVPVMSITVTDPVAAGISQTPERSGLDHVHVQVEVDRVRRQLSMFHSVLGFSVLGVPYDATETGQSTMGVESIERTAKELGIRLVSCEASLELPSAEDSLKNLIPCLERLSQESQAIYLTVSNAMVESEMESILAP